MSFLKYFGLMLSLFGIVSCGTDEVQEKKKSSKKSISSILKAKGVLTSNVTEQRAICWRPK